MRGAEDEHHHEQRGIPRRYYEADDIAQATSMPALLQEVRTTLYGNGHPGIKSDVQDLKRDIKSIKDWIEEHDGEANALIAQKSQRRFTLVVAVLTILLGQGVFFWLNQILLQSYLKP